MSCGRRVQGGGGDLPGPPSSARGPSLGGVGPCPALPESPPSAPPVCPDGPVPVPVCENGSTREGVAGVPGVSVHMGVQGRVVLMGAEGVDPPVRNTGLGVEGESRVECVSGRPVESTDERGDGVRGRGVGRRTYSPPPPPVDPVCFVPPFVGEDRELTGRTPIRVDREVASRVSSGPSLSDPVWSVRGWVTVG